jgi:hypothetical protein
METPVRLWPFLFALIVMCGSRDLVGVHGVGYDYGIADRVMLGLIVKCEWS